MKYDLMLIGPATRDVNIDYTGKEVHEIGGAVFFCAAAAKAAGANLFRFGENPSERHRYY